MGSPFEQRYSLAQFARRVGISEGRARAMFNDAGGSRLAKPDGTDPDGKPFWYARTIDDWCTRTGRRLAEDARWPYGWQAAAEPAPVVFRGQVALDDPGESVQVSVIVWDTMRGHVVYVMRYHDQHVADETAARVALQVLNPVFWTDAVVLVPREQMFGHDFEYRDVEAYRLIVPGRAVAPERGLPRFLKAVLGTPGEEEVEPLRPEQVRVERLGSPYMGPVAKAVGRPLPLWLNNTCTPAAVGKMEAFGDVGTFSVPDTLTNWPAVCERLTAVVEQSVQQRFPQAFAALAREAVRAKADLERQHTEMLDRGEGWYLVARPARPAWPVTLEHLVTSAARQQVDAAVAADELPRLRAEEADLPWGEAYGDGLYEAAGLLSGLLYRTEPDLVFSEPVREHVEVEGPVAQQYLQSLTRWPDDQTKALLARPTRRLVRLALLEQNVAALRKYGWVDELPEKIVALYEDPARRLVAEYRPSRPDEPMTLAVEWPTGMPADWTDATVIVADHRPNGGAPVFALTPTDTGELRVDPLPNPGGEPTYNWGYGGTGPSTLYEALVRCALRDWTVNKRDDVWLAYLTHGFQREKSRSTLWNFIYDHDGDIRLPWPQIRQWATEDQQLMRGQTSRAAG